VSDLLTEATPADPVMAALGGMLNSPAPAVDEEEALAILRAHYGLDGRAESLACERDANFCITTPDGRRFTMKLSNPAEPEVNINFQTTALLWLEARDPSLPVPKVVCAADGRNEFPQVLRDGRVSIVRVLTWLDGIPVARGGAVSAELRRNLARGLARLGCAFEGFEHPASGHEILWDIRNAARLRPLVVELAEPELRARLTAELDHFEAMVRPQLASLRQRVIHNDLNLHNAVIDPARPDEVSGVLDFGDMVKTPLVIDLAVACSYHTPGGPDVVADMVGAYHRILPLTPAEVALLRDLIVARLMTTVAITEGRAARYPQNAAYILRNNSGARAGLAAFASQPRDQVSAMLRAACNME
jgi:Ser/Thr protein kinase RdoA (MazF antagonist)